MRINDYMEAYYASAEESAEEDLEAGSQYGTTGWSYGKRNMAPAAGYLPQRDVAGFPKTGGGGKSMSPKVSAPKAPSTGVGTGTATGTTFKRPATPKMPRPVAPKTFMPKLSIPSPKVLEGEGAEGAYGHAHIDPVAWFRPPSLVKREKGTMADNHVPVDQPGETNDKWGDVTRRNSKETDKQRAELLKHKTPAGNPPMIPVRTSLVSPHSATYMPGMEAAENRRNRSVRTRQGMFTRYSRRGCI